MISLSFTRPRVVPNLRTEFIFFLLITKEEISKNAGNQKVEGKSFVFNRRKKLIQVWNNLRIS